MKISTSTRSRSGLKNLAIVRNLGLESDMLLSVKVNLHFRKFSAEWNWKEVICQSDSFSSRNTEKSSTCFNFFLCYFRKIFRSVENYLKCKFSCTVPNSKVWTSATSSPGLEREKPWGRGLNFSIFFQDPRIDKSVCSRQK